MPDFSFSAVDEITGMLVNHREIISNVGEPVAGYYCSYTPVEILSAAGLQPASAWLKRQVS